MLALEEESVATARLTAAVAPAAVTIARSMPFSRARGVIAAERGGGRSWLSVCLARKLFEGSRAVAPLRLPRSPAAPPPRFDVARRRYRGVRRNAPYTYSTRARVRRRRAGASRYARVPYRRRRRRDVTRLLLEHAAARTHARTTHARDARAPPSVPSPPHRSQARARIARPIPRRDLDAPTAGGTPVAVASRRLAFRRPSASRSRPPPLPAPPSPSPRCSHAHHGGQDDPQGLVGSERDAHRGSTSRTARRSPPSSASSSVRRACERKTMRCVLYTGPHTTAIAW